MTYTADTTPRRSPWMAAAVVGALALGAGVWNPSHAGCCCAPCTPAVQSAEAAILARIQVAEVTVSESVGAAAEKIHYTIRDQTSAQQEMIKGLGRQLTEQMHRQSAFQARDRVRESYSPTPETLCEDANGAASIPQGESTRQVVSGQRDEVLDTWVSESTISTPEKIITGAQMESADLDVDALLFKPVEDTEGREAKEKLLQRLIDFQPPEPPSEAQADTPKGVVMQFRLNERQMRLEPSSAVIKDRASKTDPVYPAGDWVEDLMEETGFDETEEGQKIQSMIDDQDGRVSYDVRQRLQVLSRSLDSLPYLQKLETMQGDDLTRELIRQQALANRLSYDRLRMAQRMAILQASGEADRVNRATREQINRLRVESSTYSD